MLDVGIPTIAIAAVGAVCSILFIVFIYLIKQYRYWRSLGIPGPFPSFILGNMGDLYYHRASELRIMDGWFQEFKGEPYIGFYNLWKPTLFVMDPQLIRQLNEVDFDHFEDHTAICGNSKRDAILHSLFTMKGAIWKAKRQIFSTLFSPKKLKEYCEIMNQHGSSLIEDIHALSELQEEIPLEDISKKNMVTTMSHIMYSLDVSQNDEMYSKLDHLSQLFERPPQATILKFTFYSVAPRLLNFLGVSTYPREFWNFFSKFTKDLVKSRNEMDIGREDLVSLVAHLQKEGSLGTDKIGLRESVGHMFSFFSAGIHSNHTTLSYALFQLSRHPEIQEKLRNEVDNVLAGNDYVSYDDLMKMKFLEAVINETLRMSPLGGILLGAGILKRVCTIPYKISDKFTIPKGMDVVFPVYSLHMDSKYFPAPEKFIPERFLDPENLSPVFMPFGKGPRSCIGKRFSYLSLKVALAKIISNYKILPSSNTDFPVKFDPRSLLIASRPLRKLKVKMQKRERS